MFANFMKWVSIAALLLAAIAWRFAGDYQLLLQFVICLGAITVVMQALRETEYRWAAGFAMLAMLFNPAVPVFKFSGPFSLLLVLLCIAPFAASLAALKTRPRLSIPSITYRTPGSESL